MLHLSLLLYVFSLQVFAEDKIESKIHEANFKFGWQLFRKLSSKQPDENVFFSPMSINAALCMVLAGARGKSASQMSKTLHLNDVNPRLLHSAVGNTLVALNKSAPGVTTNLANKLYVQKTMKVLPEFVNTIKTSYHSSVRQVDFSKHFESVRLEINNWVEKVTKKKIRNLLLSKSLDVDTKLVLVNAIYFKGLWQKSFNKEESYNGKFYHKSKDKNPSKIKFMRLKGRFNFARSDELRCSLLELAFKGRKSGMIFILPNDIDGLNELEAKLDATKLGNLMKQMTPILVETHIPRFKLESTFNLENTLPGLGMKDVFLPNRADLSGIHKGLFISKIIHKACLEVNEDGATAAAATADVMVMRSLPLAIENIVFKADHPFLVAIHLRDQTTFLGAVKSPEPL